MRDIGKDIEPGSPSASKDGGGAMKRGPERRCVECGVKLSLYNPGPNCWQHTIGWPWRGPSAKPRF